MHFTDPCAIKSHLRDAEQLPPRRSIFDLMVIDDYFDEPDRIRELALSQRFDYPKRNFPGSRSRLLYEVQRELDEALTEELSICAFSGGRIKISSLFQWTPAIFESGWVHADTDVSVAGVIYLNCQPPINSGTSFFYPNFVGDVDIETFNVRDQFYRGEPIDINMYREARDAHNARFSKTISVDNVFNRCLIFDAQTFHKENLFFGESKLNARLTLLFFANTIN